LAKSSADSIGVSILSTVRKAARLAVYEEMMIKVKNHHTDPTMRPETDLQSTKTHAQSARSKFIVRSMYRQTEL
jgi:hypothetical protein